MTTIHFETGNFGTTIALEGIPTLPVNNIRKLLKLMFSDPKHNCKAIWMTRNWIPDAIMDAKNSLAYAIALYKDGYRTVPKGYRSVGATQQRRKNRSLITAVKLEKINHDQLVKFQSIFNEIKEKKNYAY